jgi:hypothetical protein
VATKPGFWVTADNQAEGGVRMVKLLYVAAERWRELAWLPPDVLVLEPLRRLMPLH